MFKIALLLMLLASAACRRGEVSKSLTEDSVLPDQQGHPNWVLSGYLPKDLYHKVYLEIESGKIKDILERPPREGLASRFLDTDSVIFPGLIDMHNHVQYNVLPLWKRTRGQYKNRFEWRKTSCDYKKAVSGNMGAFKRESLCAAVRYAEIKALVGGATAIQGVGGHGDCAGDGFGVRNIEGFNAFGQGRYVRSYVDVVNPYPITNIYQEKLKPLIAGEGLNYNQAYEKMLVLEGVSAWTEDFKEKWTSDPSFENAMFLMTSNPTGGRNFNIVGGQEKIAEYKALSRQTKAQLTDTISQVVLQDAGDSSAQPLPFPELIKGAPFFVAEWQHASQLKKATEWIWQFMKGVSDDEEEPLETQIRGFLTPDGNLAFDRNLRKFMTDFHAYVWSAIDYSLREQKVHGVIAHLAEGRADDEYNQSELETAKGLELVRKGLVFIHGVGFKDFSELKNQDVSIVWSPFSNLLLYNQTLDIKKALESGINVAIGPDWTPTGSKNMLDELKMARRYLDQQRIMIKGRPITNEKLVEMATINGAKALGLQEILGKVAKGYLADLMLVKRERFYKDGYNMLLEKGDQRNITLMVVNGQPIYGDLEKLQLIKSGFADDIAVQRISLSPTNSCGDMAKALRIPYSNAYDRENPAHSFLRNIAGLKEALDTAIKAGAARLRERAVGDRLWEAVHIVDEIDPLYVCEDQDYGRRIEGFLTEETKENADKRGQIRDRENWSPCSEVPATHSVRF